MKTSARPVVGSTFRRVILKGSLFPAAFAAHVQAVNLGPVPDVPVLNIDTDLGVPFYLKGLQEGFVAGNDNETTPNPVNGPDSGNGAGISLGLRMAQSNVFDPLTGWANSRTWIYTGQVNTGPNGIISFAANNDDTDWLSINGVVVLNDNGWDTANATVVTGLTPSTWVPFEYRVSDTGAGGAGPSGQNINGAAGWTTTLGAVMSYDNENGSILAGDYGLGAPTEPTGGAASMFRHQSGVALTDALIVRGAATINIAGSNPLVVEPNLSFNGSHTLTINDAVGTVHKQLRLSGVTQWALNANPVDGVVTLDGSVDVRPLGIQRDFNKNVTVVRNGPGALILDTFNVNSSVATTTFAANTGLVSVSSGTGTTPVTGAKLAITGNTGVLRIGSISGVGTYANAITATASGTLEHSAAATDTLSGTITVNAGNNLNFNVTGGRLQISGALNAVGANTGFTKSGTNTMRTVGPVSTTNLIINGGRLEVEGPLTLTNSPTMNGGTLALLNTTGGNVVPDPFVISGAGTVEARDGSFGTPTTTVEITAGGTLGLFGNTGLSGSFYAGDDGGAHNNFGGPDLPANTYATYTSYFTTRGGTGLQASALTSAGNVQVLSFDPAGGDTAMFSMYGYNQINNIVARMVGKIFIAEAGNYTFGTTSDDGSMLFINGQAVVSNNVYQGMFRRTGSVALTAGFHDIDIGFYEGGGGNGLVVDWAGPGIAGTQPLPNSVLVPSLAPEQMPNSINVNGSGTINVLASSGQITGNVTMQSNVTLTLTGRNLIVDNLILPVSGGTYTLAPANETVLSHITDNGNPVTIQKNGAGVLTIDNLGAPQLQNPASVISVNQGAIGILLGGVVNPMGNATINYNGGGVVVSSRGGDQSFPIPNFTGNAVLQARKLASGVDGPVTITLLGNLSVNAGATITLGTADNYTQSISGSATGTGTVGVSGGTVNSTTNTALQGLRVNFNGVGTSATLNLQTNAPSVGAVNSEFGATAGVVVGDGLGGAATLNISGSADGQYSGSLIAAGISTFDVVKNGPGRQRILGPSTATAYTVNAGTLELAEASLADAGVPINLTGGALQFSSPGLSLRIYDSDPRVGIGNIPNAYSGILDTLPGVFQRYGAMANLLIDTTTASNGNTLINYNPAATDTAAPFFIHGHNNLDNVEAIFTGFIDIPTAGNWTFDPRSDDGTNIFINGQLVAANNVPQGIGHVPRPGTINLSEGLHSFVMTYNEGGGGAGMFVNLISPNGSIQLMPNALLRNANVTLPNNVNIAGTSAINPNTGVLNLGSATQFSGATLGGSGGGIVSFLQTTVTGGTVLSYNPAANTTIRPGQIIGASTINAGGGGSVLLDYNGLQLTPGTVNANGGKVIAATQLGGANPLGTAEVNLSNGGALQLTSAVPAGDATYNNPVTVGTGGGAIEAGRFQHGAPGAFVMTYTAPISVGNAAPLSFAARDNYSLVMSNSVISNGAITSAAGNVQTGAALTGTTLAVNGGRLDTLGPLNFAGGVTVANNATLRLNGNTYTGGTIQLPGGTLEFNGNSTGALPTNIDGGRIRVTSGVVDLQGASINGSTVNVVSEGNVLSARSYASVNPPGGFGEDAGVLLTLASTPAIQRPLGKVAFGGAVDNRDLNFGPISVADAAYNAFFGAPTGDAFTAAFVGKFNAANNGAYTFGESIRDDDVAVWMDLNQNGVFERFGSSGDERILSGACCGGAGADNTNNVVVNLIGGQSYNMAFMVQDTGGGSSFAAKWAEGSIPGPGGLSNFVNPADPAQAGVWSVEAKTGGAKIEVAASAELKLGGVSNVTDVLLSGENAKITFNASPGVNSTLEVVRTANSTSVNPAVLEVSGGNTLNVAHLTISQGNGLNKTGAGTLIAPGLSVGASGTFGVQDGLVIYTAAALSSNGTANNGAVSIFGPGVFDLEGTLSGSITINNGGTLLGAGTGGPVVSNSGAILSPGGPTGTGTLTTGDLLLLDGSIFRATLNTVAASDQVIANGGVLLSDAPGTILELTLAPTFNAAINDQFPLILNDIDDPVTGHFAGLLEGGFLTIGNHGFTISYASNADGGAVGNDVVLTYTVPEPGALAMLLGGFGMLLGVQRLRRKG